MRIRNRSLILIGCLVMCRNVALVGALHAQPPTSEQGEPSEVPVLEGTRWLLLDLAGKKIDVKSRTRPFVQFDKATERLAGYTGVNHFSGGYELDGSDLKLGPLAVTRRAGPVAEMQIESQLLKVFSPRCPWKIKEGALELGEDNQVVARFRPDTTAIIGTLQIRERITLPPDALLEIRLEDVTDADAPATLIAMTQRKGLPSPPLRFLLPYDADRIDPERSYSIRAEIRHDNRLLFTTGSTHRVITRGYGNSVDVLLKKVLVRKD